MKFLLSGKMCIFAVDRTIILNDMKKLFSTLIVASLMMPALALAQNNSEDNEVVKTIMERRSVRKYLDKQVEHAKLEVIARCGVNAPNGMNKQPWAVRIVESKEWIDGVTSEFVKKNKEMAERDKNFKNMFRNAPNVIVIATPKGQGQIDAGLMGGNMVIAAQSLGLGTCCLGGPVQFVKNDESAKLYLEKLQIPDGYEIAYMIAVGYPDEQPEAKPRDMNKILYIK